MKRNLWLGAVAFGLFFILIGATFVYMGYSAKAEIRNNLIAENIITSKDASIPEVLVRDAATAKAQAEVITLHSVERWGYYSEMDREDPNRELYMKGLVLRNSLWMAYMGFNVADLVMGVGAVVMAVGASTLVIGTPALYWVGHKE